MRVWSAMSGLCAEVSSVEIVFWGTNNSFSDSSDATGDSGEFAIASTVEVVDLSTSDSNVSGRSGDSGGVGKASSVEVLDSSTADRNVSWCSSASLNSFRRL